MISNGLDKTLMKSFTAGSLYHSIGQIPLRDLPDLIHRGSCSRCMLHPAKRDWTVWTGVCPLLPWPAQSRSTYAPVYATA